MAQAQTSKPTAPAVVPPADVKGAHRNVFEGADLSHYVKGAAKTASGNKTHDSGDEVAAKYRGLSIDLVYADAAKVLGVPVNELLNKYSKLNVGMQRMNLGNRVRAKLANPEGKPKKAAKPAAPVPTVTKANAKPANAKPAKEAAKPAVKK